MARPVDELLSPDAPREAGCGVEGIRDLPERAFHRTVASAEFPGKSSAMPKPPPIGYTVKFEGFIRMCDDAKKTGLQQVAVAHPSVIGDNYDEMVESLSRLAKAGLSLAIAKPE